MLPAPLMMKEVRRGRAKGLSFERDQHFLDLFLGLCYSIDHHSAHNAQNYD
jgi:hypothetical protein